VGPLWIGPPWEPPPTDALPVTVDPGRAFGTGAHATTRLCLELLTRLERGSLADLGCGSGVLAIAGVRLGFAPVVAVDVDSAALEATAQNAAANDTPLEVRALDVSRDALPAAAAAVANISLELVETVLARRDAPIVIASGYLERDEPSLGAYRRRERRTLDGWAADLLERAQ
jgi:ribosomal protein L11 methyltransferase